LNAVYRRLLKMALEELRLIEEQIGQLDQEMASLLSQHQDAVQRLAEVPGLGVDSAQQWWMGFASTTKTRATNLAAVKWWRVGVGTEALSLGRDLRRSPQPRRKISGYRRQARRKRKRLGRCDGPIATDVRGA
jgi:hypothetical protein